MSTFLVQQQELADRLVAYDQTDSADATKLKRWLNMAQQYICGKRLWPFMLAEEIIQTVTDYTTGTVSTTAGSSTVTFSTTIAASKTNQYIETSSSSDWYQITAHTAGTATATISPAAITTASAATYTIRKLLYTTTTPLFQIIDMKQLVTPTAIISQSPREMDFLLPLTFDSGTPYYYIMSSPNSSGTPQFSFLNSPSTTMNIMIRGIKALADLSADGDISIIPGVWHDAIIHIAAFYGFQGLDDSRATTEFQAGESRIADMAKNYAHDQGRHRVMQGLTDDSNFGLQWGMPSNYGPWVD